MVALAGHPLERYQVDEPRGVLEDGTLPLRRGRRGDEDDPVDPVPEGVRRDLARLLGGEVDDEDAVRTGGRGLGKEPVGPPAVDDVIVGEEDEGQCRRVLPDLPDEGEDAVRGGARPEGADVRPLDHGAVRHRVGVGESDLEEVDARIDHRPRHPKRRLDARVPGDGKPDEDRVFPGKKCLDPAHDTPP